MSKEIGTLVVVVLKARNLRDKHTIHKQDVFAQATLNKMTKKTKTDVRGGQHPVWDEELRFPIFKNVSDETRKLEIACYSKEPRSDDFIGRGTVDISETLKTGEFDDWVPLQMEDGQYRGDIFLEMTFYSAAPPPQRRPSKWQPKDRLKRP
ncbi:C2 domain-containing protein, partial [Cerioporus squamosus]